MQEHTPTIPHWTYQALAALATFLAGGGIYKLISIYLNWHKPAAEIQRTDAETTEIMVRAHSSAGDAVIRIMNRLDEAQIKSDGLIKSLDTALMENMTLKREVAQQATELEFAEKQMKRMKGLMDSKGIRYSEIDEHVL